MFLVFILYICVVIPRAIGGDKVVARCLRCLRWSKTTLFMDNLIFMLVNNHCISKLKLFCRTTQYDRAADPYPERKGAHHVAPFLCLPVLWRVACWLFGAPSRDGLQLHVTRHPHHAEWWLSSDQRIQPCLT